MRIGRLLAVAGLMVLTAVQPAVAFAAPDRIELSTDGESYTTSLTQPLFAHLGPLVPLDDEVRSFWVRNASAVPARVSLEVLPSGITGDLAEHLQVTTSIGGVVTRRGVESLTKGRCQVILTSPTLPPGGAEQVDVGLHLPDLPGQVGQASTVNLAMTVHLSQVNRRGVVRVCGVQAAAEPVDPCLVVPILGADAANGCGAGVDRGGTEGSGVEGGDRTGGEVAAVAGNAGEPDPGDLPGSDGLPDADTASIERGSLPGTGAPVGGLVLLLAAVSLMGFGALLLGVSATSARGRSTTAGGR